MSSEPCAGCAGEGRSLLGREESVTAADVVLGFRDDRIQEEVDRYDDREEEQLLQDGVEEELLARFTSTGEIEFEERGEERSAERNPDYNW